MNDYKSITIGGIEITPLKYFKEKLAEISIQLNGGMSDNILHGIVNDQSKFSAIEQIAHTLYLQRRAGGIGGSETADIIEASRIYDEVNAGQDHCLHVNKPISEIPFKIIKKGTSEGPFDYMVTPRTLLYVPNNLHLPSAYGEGESWLYRDGGNWDKIDLEFPGIGGGYLNIKGRDFAEMQTLGWSGFPAAMSLLDIDWLLEDLEYRKSKKNEREVEEFSLALRKDGHRISYKDFVRLAGNSAINLDTVALKLPGALTQEGRTEWTREAYKDYLRLEGKILKTELGEFLDIDGHTHPGGRDEPLEWASAEDVLQWLSAMDEEFSGHGYSGYKPFNMVALILPMYEENGEVVVGDLMGYNLQSILNGEPAGINDYVQKAQEAKEIKKRWGQEGYTPTPEEEGIVEEFRSNLKKLQVSIEDSSLFDFDNDKPWSS